MSKNRNSRTQNTVLNLISGVGGEILINIFSFATRTVFIQTLGKQYLGIGGLFTNILALLSLTDLGLGIALNYRLYEPLKEKNVKRLQILMNFYKIMYRIIGLVILLLGLCIIPFLPVFIKDYSTFEQLNLNAAVVFLCYLMQTVSTYWFFAYKSAIVKADQKEYYLNVAGYIFTFISNIIQIIVLIIWKSFLIYLLVIIGINIIQGLVNAKIADKYYPFLKEKCKDSIEKEEKREIFKDCGSISIFSISSEILKSTDNLVLSTFIGLGIVGLYSNYLMLYNMLKKIIKRLIRSAQASLGNLFASAEDKVRCEFFSVMNCFMLLMCGTASVCIAVLADEFITVWIGNSYVIPMPFSVLIAMELYTIGIKLILEQMRDVMGLFQKVRWRPIASMIINVILSIVLVQYWGIYGVLVGTLLSEWLTTFLIDPRMVYFHGFHNYNSVKNFYIKNGIYIIELFFIGMCNFWLLKNVFINHGWVSFILHSIICALTTVAFLIICNLHDQAMRELLARGIRIIKRRK